LQVSVLPGGYAVSELQVELVAADRRVWTGPATMVRCRTASGELGIMPGHTPLLGVLVAGDVTIHRTEGPPQQASVDSGFLSVEHDRVTIVADAVDAADIAD
jgi:F-type H+-transporting ATPase subunit epsilon